MGIAGAISPMLTLGDVVIVTGVIHYDQRKETPTGTARRGQEIPVPARTRHAINAFFSDHGEPYRATVAGSDGIKRTCAVWPGLIGSGEAVVADQNSLIRSFVTTFNEKALALETEAAGIAEAFYETADTLSAGTGWLSIRGISDCADAAKDNTYHEIASWHAAAILRQMLPYLKVNPAA
jgi:adenosylhomocysteine nucleosidase